MRYVERGTDCTIKPVALGSIQPSLAFKHPLQRTSDHVFHFDQMQSSILSEGMDRNHVGMDERGGSPRFGKK